ARAVPKKEKESNEAENFGLLLREKRCNIDSRNMQRGFPKPDCYCDKGDHLLLELAIGDAYGAGFELVSTAENIFNASIRN
ncbi:MAG TPA: hypothetical protein VNE61_14175, partial [Ktedonobacteraceae bacterium]|nr:hypothetical protein [Ktedonobacteraceae bacterium]